MRCLAILLCEDSDNPANGEVSLLRLRERLGFDNFPAESILTLFVAVEMERGERGKPIDLRTELLHVDRADPAAEIFRSSAIIQMPMDQQLPPIFTMSIEARWPFNEPGVYEIAVYLNDELAAHRRIAVVQTAPEDG